MAKMHVLTCTWVCSCVLECAGLCLIVLDCAQVCLGMLGCTRVCSDVHTQVLGCARFFPTWFGFIPKWLGFTWVCTVGWTEYFSLFREKHPCSSARIHFLPKKWFSIKMLEIVDDHEEHCTGVISSVLKLWCTGY